MPWFSLRYLLKLQFDEHIRINELIFLWFFFWLLFLSQSWVWQGWLELLCLLFLIDVVHLLICFSIFIKFIMNQPYIFILLQVCLLLCLSRAIRLLRILVLLLRRDRIGNFALKRRDDTACLVSMRPVIRRLNLGWHNLGCYTAALFNSDYNKLGNIFKYWWRLCSET